jgi:hypothetical protein
LEGYRKHRVLFNRLGATIIAASVDLLEDMRLLAEGKRFPKREKNMGFTFCYGVTRELADKDYMQPAEFIIDCEINKVISCAYSDGGLGRMDAGDVVGVLSSIQNIKDEMPHVWSW